MRQFFRALGWLIAIAGGLVSLLACLGMAFALLVPDTNGSPDASGMQFGASLVLLLIVGLPVSIVGAVVLWLAGERDKGGPMPLPPGDTP
jgi:hypothetical protein